MLDKVARLCVGVDSNLGYPRVPLECLNSLVDVFDNTWMFHTDNLTGWDGVPRSTPFMDSLFIHLEIWENFSVILRVRSGVS